MVQNSERRQIYLKMFDRVMNVSAEYCFKTLAE